MPMIIPGMAEFVDKISLLLQKWQKIGLMYRWHRKCYICPRKTYR